MPSPDQMQRFIPPKLQFPTQGVKLLLCLALLAAGMAQASTVIVSAPGVPTIATSYPFSEVGAGTTSDHYQQIYSNLILKSPFTINAIDFYTDPNAGGQLLNNSTWTVRIAATTQWINNISDMTHSIVDDASHVHAVTPQTFYTGQVTIGAGGVVRIAGAPFTFNPTMGNLIVDIIRTPLGTPTTGGAKFLAQTGGYSSTRLYNNVVKEWGSATNPNWNYPFSRASNYWGQNQQEMNENYGMVTGFEYAPEPGTFLLMGGGLGIGFLVARRRAKRA